MTGALKLGESGIVLVLVVRLITQMIPSHCTSNRVLLIHVKVPDNSSDCPNTMPLNTQPPSAAHLKIFAFMLPLNRETQCGCKLCLVCLLEESFASSHSDSLL